MSDRKLKPGFTAFDNSLLELLAKAPLSKNEKDVINCVLRQTDGFHREECDLSVSFLAKMMNRDSKTVSKTVNSLVRKNVIVVYEGATFSKPRRLGLNKEFSGWLLNNDLGGGEKSLPRGESLIGEGMSTGERGNIHPNSNKNLNSPGEKYSTKKESLKENLNKDLKKEDSLPDSILLSCLPQYFSKEQFNSLQFREAWAAFEDTLICGFSFDEEIFDSEFEIEGTFRKEWVKSTLVELQKLNIEEQTRRLWYAMERGYEFPVDRFDEQMWQREEGKSWWIGHDRKYVENWEKFLVLNNLAMPVGLCRMYDRRDGVIMFIPVARELACQLDDLGREKAIEKVRWLVSGEFLSAWKEFLRVNKLFKGELGKENFEPNLVAIRYLTYLVSLDFNDAMSGLKIEFVTSDITDLFIEYYDNNQLCSLDFQLAWKGFLEEIVNDQAGGKIDKERVERILGNLSRLSIREQINRLNGSEARLYLFQFKAMEPDEAIKNFKRSIVAGFEDNVSSELIIPEEEQLHSGEKVFRQNENIGIIIDSFISSTVFIKDDGSYNDFRTAVIDKCPALEKFFKQFEFRDDEGERAA
jgi:phage replication O-like protein O